MNIILYGAPAETAERIARRYGLETVHTPETFHAAGCLLLVPPMETARQFLNLCDALLRHEHDADAVVLCGEPCATASAVQYCAAHGKLFTLGADLDDGELERELAAILDILAGRICAHEGI